MQNVVNDSFVVNSGGAWVYLARVELIDGANAEQADIASIVRSITDTKTRAVTETTLDVSEVIFDTLQSDTRWVVGGAEVPFNFEDRLPATAIPARRKYLLQYTLTPQGGGEVVKTREIDVVGD